MRDGRSTGRRWLRRLAIGGGVLVLVIVVLLFAAGRYLRAAVVAEDLEVLLNDALAEATDGLYTASLQAIEWRRGGTGLRLRDLSLMLDLERVAAMQEAGTLPPIVFQLQHATVDLNGIDLWSLLRGRGLRAYSLQIDQPLIQLSGLEAILGRVRPGAPPAPAAPAAAAAAAAPAERPAEAPDGTPATALPASATPLPETSVEDERTPGPPAASGLPGEASLQRPPIRIWRVRLADARLESYRRGGEAATGDVRDSFELYESFSGVDVAIDDLDLANPDPSRFLYAADVELEIAEYYYLWPDGLHEERHGPIAFSTATGTLRVDNFELAPRFERRPPAAATDVAIGAEAADTSGEPATGTLAAAAGVAPGSEVPAQRHITMEAVLVDGLDIPLLLESRQFRAREFAMRNVRVDVVGDAPAAEQREREPAGSVTAPLTDVRPGAILTEALAGLPTIEVEHLELDGSLDYRVDRDADGWLERPVRYYGLDALHVELGGYRSGAGVAFDPSRPLFADRWEVAADRIVATLGAERHRVEMDNWRSSSAARDLSVDALRAEPLVERRTPSVEGADPPALVRIATGAVHLEGVDYGSLIEDIDVEVDRITIEHPDVRVTTSEGVAPHGTRGVRGRKSTPAETIGAVVLGMPSVAIGRVVVHQARYERTVDRIEGRWLDSPVQRILIENLEADFEALEHQEGDSYDGTRPLFAERVRATAGTVAVGVGDGFERLTLSGLVVASAEHDARVEALHYGPVTADRERLVRRVRERSIADVSTGPVSLTGTLIPTYLQSGEWVLDRVEVHDPTIRVFETLRATPPADDGGTDRPRTRQEGETNTEALAAMLDRSDVVRVGQLELTGGTYERRVASPRFDWGELPPPLEELRDLDLRLDGFDTDPARGRRRLLLSDAVSLSIGELTTPLGDSGAALTLSGLTLSSGGEDALEIDRALLSTRGSDGDNDFRFGRIELARVPFGRLFRALIEPRRRGAPLIAALADRDLRITIAGLAADLDAGARSLRTGPMRGTAAAGDLRIDDVLFGPTLPDADPATLQTEVADDEFVFRADGVELRGFDFNRLAETGAIAAVSVRVEAPYLGLVRGQGATDGEAASGPDGDPVPVASASDPVQQRFRGMQAVAEELQAWPVVQIGDFRADDIVVHELPSVEGRPLRALEHVDVAITDLDLRPDRGPVDAAGPLYAADIRVAMPRQRTWLDNTGYEIEFGPLALSTGQGVLDLGRVAYRPPFTPDQFLERTRIIEGDRLEIEAGSTRLDDIDMEALLSTGALVVGRAEVADWSVQVLSDRHKPANPRRRLPTYPHEAMQRLPLRLSVDRVDLVNGSVRYSERHAQGSRPGSIWWDRMQGSITNLSNDPRRMSTEHPAVLSLSARMLDEANLQLEWRLPLLAPGPTMSYRGQLSPMRAELLTSILVPLDGVRITRGVIDQTSFEVEVRGGHATGTLEALYHDLGVQFEDRNTGGRSLGKRLMSFAAGVLMPHNNRDRDGKPARVGTIDWTATPEDPFFKVFWAALRAGVIDLVMP